MIRKIGIGLFYLGMANFAFAAIGSVLLGGDAMNGTTEDGRYYLGNHGSYTEVSKAIFTYSLWHWRSIFVTHPLAILCAALVNGMDHKKNSN